MPLHHLSVGWRTVHRDKNALKVGVDDEWDLSLVLVGFEWHNVVPEAPFREDALRKSRTTCRVNLIAVHFMSLQPRLKVKIMQALEAKINTVLAFGDLRSQEPRDVFDPNVTVFRPRVWKLLRCREVGILILVVVLNKEEVDVTFLLL